MSLESVPLFWYFSIAVILLVVIGIYCVIASYNLIRVLIGVEILIKAVTLLIVAVGFVSGHTALAQSLVITLIVVEVVFITVAIGVVIGIERHHDSLDVRKIRQLKG